MKGLLVLLLCAFVTFAQDEREQRTVELKHITAVDLGGVLANLVMMNHDGSGRFLVLRGTPGALAEAEALIKRMDTPKQVVELTFHILAAGQSPAGKVPSDLEPVVKQLRASFSYPEYQLLETAFVRAREGSNFEALGTVDSTEYRIAADRPIQIKRVDGKTYVQSYALVFRISGKGAAQIVAPLEVREGQRVVIGKSSAPSAGGAIFLVVSAKVVD